MVDTLAQVLICRVVGKPYEFVLNGLGKARVLDDRILRHLAREFRVEVCNVQHRFLESRVRSNELLLKRVDLQRWA